MRRHPALAPVLLLAVSLTLAACGDTEPAAPSEPDQVDLVGRTFVGDQVTVDDEPSPLVKDTSIRLTFSDGSIGASAGCNQMGGDATWADGVLKVQNMFTTEMACDEPLMQQDTWLSDFLSSEPTVQQDGDTLTLTSGGTVVVLTDEEVAVPDVALTGTTWTLDSIVAGDAVSSVPSGVTSTLTFTDKGRVQVRPGCNTGNGGYSVDDAAITFDPIAVTRMACDGPRGDVEDTVLGVLDGQVPFVIDGDTLTLTPAQPTADGTTGLVYRAG